MIRYGTANFGIAGTDWQQKINWDRLRTYRLESARARMKAHGLGAMLCMYDENVRYITGTLTPGWNRLKPGLRYALLCGDAAPVLFEQGDIGMQVKRHSPWIPEENVRYSYAWIKGAAGAASEQQVTKFTNAIKEEMARFGVAGEKLGVDFVDMQGWIIEGFRRGGVITISWHMDNPASMGSSWDTTRAVHTILPGGEKHEMFKSWLDRFVEFDKGLIADGTPIPIIFRPWHEHSGSWFWWGGDNVTPEEYIQLWKFTVEYLRDENDLHNLLYAYSTDVIDTEEEYFEHYPGDEWVDLLGYDDYRSLRSEETVADMTRRLRMIVELAEARGKLSAVTESGAMGLRVEDWWTGRVLIAIETDSVARRALYFLVWRNEGERQFFAPYEGHPNNADFVAFYRDPFVLFEDGLPPLYEWNP